MRIIIGGLAGTGKSSLSRLIASSMGIPLLPVGSIFRDLARERGVTLVELNAQMLLEPYVDEEVAKRIRDFVDQRNYCVVEGWFAWYCVRDLQGIFRVKLTCQDLERFVRIAIREQSALKMVKAETQMRETMMIARFAERCHVPDWNDDRHFDFVIDTTKLDHSQVYEAVLSAISSRVITP